MNYFLQLIGKDPVIKEKLMKEYQVKEAKIMFFLDYRVFFDQEVVSDWMWDFIANFYPEHFVMSNDLFQKIFLVLKESVKGRMQLTHQWMRSFYRK